MLRLGRGPERLTSLCSVSKIEHMSDYWIQASEVGAYTFCHQAWWLQYVAGVHPQDAPVLTAGLAHHQQHGQQVQRAGRYRLWAYALLGMALVLMALWWATL